MIDCPKCKTSMEADARFCPECGHPTLAKVDGCDRCGSCGWIGTCG